MKLYENISLKPYNTFGIDVKARRMVVIEPDDEIPQQEGEVIILGGGSNMVFTKDYDGTVITLSHSSDQLPTVNCQQSTVEAWGGMVMDDLVQWTLDNGLYGLENLSAIPGTVGASAVQNVGAYGAEAKDFIVSVAAYDLVERRLCTFNNEECQFAYRDSYFKHHPNRYLILRVTYRLSCTFTPNLSYKALENVAHDTAQQLREAIVDVRWSKLPRPEEHGSAGSFFKNPVVDEATYLRLKAEYPDMPTAHPVTQSPSHPVTQYKLSAGWLIDRAGWKGRTQGRAGVWPKNALVLYNLGDGDQKGANAQIVNAAGCTGDEVQALACAIQDDIKTKFNVTLTPEAIII